MTPAPSLLLVWSSLLGAIVLLAFAYYFKRRQRGSTEQFVDMDTNMEQVLMDEAKRLLTPTASTKQDVLQAMKALNALVAAVRLRDGDEGANALLERGRALFQEREGSDQERARALDLLREEASMLAEQGKEGILAAALQDGSSVLCRKCSGLVKRDRWDAHSTMWCPALDE